MMMMKAARQQQGLTLIEILVVVAILGLLAALVVPNVIGRGEQARVDMAKANMQGIANALDMYRMDNGRYPTTEQGLEALVREPADARNWNPDGYLSEVPTDPWGNEFVYISPGRDGPFDLYSLGADGREGGDGHDAEISYRESRDGNRR